MAEEKDDPPAEEPPAPEETPSAETPPEDAPAGETPAEEPPPAAAAEIPAEEPGAGGEEEEPPPAEVAAEEVSAEAEEEAPAEAEEEVPAEAEEEAPAEGEAEEAPAEIEEEEAPAEEDAEEDPEEDPEEDAEDPIQYPLSFKDVLFSFRGRLNRKAYWLKGVLPALVIGIVLQSVVSGLAVFVFGVQMFSMMGTMEPLAAGGYSRFEKSGEQVIGLVTRQTGPASLEVEFTAAETTDRINKTVIVGNRRLRITAAKKADAPSYDMDFRWQNYPTAAGAPDPALDEGWPILEIAVSVLAIAVAALQMWISFALAIKRFHDRDRKGWWVLIILIPIIGALWLFVVLGFLKGTEGANRFGPDPLAAEGGG